MKEMWIGRGVFIFVLVVVMAVVAYLWVGEHNRDRGLRRLVKHGPYLVSDYGTEALTYYEIKVTFKMKPDVDKNGRKRMKVDMGEFPPMSGLEIKACNEFGCSDPVYFPERKEK